MGPTSTPATRNRMSKLPAGTLSKVPEVTLGFWVIKVLATTLGETGGDAVTMSMKSGLCDWQFHFYRHFRRCRRRANLREGIPSLPLLGHNRRDDNLGDDHGGF